MFKLFTFFGIQGACGDQSEGFCNHLLHFIRKSCKVPLFIFLLFSSDLFSLYMLVCYKLWGSIIMIMMVLFWLYDHDGLMRGWDKCTMLCSLPIFVPRLFTNSFLFFIVVSLQVYCKVQANYASNFSCGSSAKVKPAPMDFFWCLWGLWLTWFWQVLYCRKLTFQWYAGIAGYY